MRTILTTPASQQPAEAAGQSEIEFVILAERVEVLNGKLYMMGGGYDCLLLERPPPQTMPVTFAVVLLVPWEASGREHHLQFAVLDEAGNTVAASDQLALNRNCPHGLGDRESRRVTLAPLGGPVTFPSYGKFVLRVVLDGAVQKTVMFSVVDRERGLNG